MTLDLISGRASQSKTRHFAGAPGKPPHKMTLDLISERAPQSKMRHFVGARVRWSRFRSRCRRQQDG
jgi:hypothetical protein